MADGTLDSAYLVLKDNWPGAPAHNLSTPTDGFTGATHHNVATAAYTLGTKIQVYNTGTTGPEGFATFIYLQIVGTVAAAREVCALDVKTSMTIVTNVKAGDLIGTGLPTCVSISAMTTAYYGWFWCGGVAAEEFVADLDGDIATDSGVALGSGVVAADLTGTGIGYSIAIGDATDLIAAFALKTDTNP